MDNNLNPWNFHNTDKVLVSPDLQFKLVYYDLNEIAMGAPLGGPCFLEGNGEKIKIHDWCGGPPVWEIEGEKFAIPIWTKSFFTGTIQQIGIVDIKSKKLRIFDKTFRVLNFLSFDKNIISGFDSPIYNKEILSFNIEEEIVERTINLI